METAHQLRRPLEVVSQNAYSVLASLPKNSTSFALKAQEGGADGVILNIDGDENASPEHFGSYDLHDAYINDVISTISIPCGLFIGGGHVVTEEYWEKVMTSSFGFVEMFAHQMPAFVLADGRIKKFAAISTGYILEQVKKLSVIDGIDALDFAAVPPQGRGAPFTVLDFATLGVIANLSTRPLFLRTQKRLTRPDIANILALGVKGLVVDPCIFSGTDEAYKDEIAGLTPRRNPAEE